MHYEIILKKAHNKAFAMCSRQEMCAFDIKTKLQRWEINDDDIDDIISKLIDENFINELRFSTFFTRDKIRFNKWGKQKVEYQLLQKKISPNVIADAFEEVDEKEYLTIIEDQITKKLKNTKGKNNFDIKAKIMRFAASRGYELGMVNSIVEKMLISNRE